MRTVIDPDGYHILLRDGENVLPVGNVILVAHVEVGGEKLTVKADMVNDALIALHGKPVAGMRCTADIVFDAMTRAEFAALPEWQ